MPSLCQALVEALGAWWRAAAAGAAPSSVCSAATAVRCVCSPLAPFGLLFSYVRSCAAPQSLACVCDATKRTDPLVVFTVLFLCITRLHIFLFLQVLDFASHPLLQWLLIVFTNRICSLALWLPPSSRLREHRPPWASCVPTWGACLAWWSLLPTSSWCPCLPGVGSGIGAALMCLLLSKWWAIRTVGCVWPQEGSFGSSRFHRKMLTSNSWSFFKLLYYVRHWFLSWGRFHVVGNAVQSLCWRSRLAPSHLEPAVFLWSPA